jgi:hypothetical protein
VCGVSTFFYGKPLKSDLLGRRGHEAKGEKDSNCDNLLSFMEMAIEANAIEILQGSMP